MPLTSDLKIDASKFDPKNITKETNDFNDGLIKIMNGVPKWWEVCNRTVLSTGFNFASMATCGTMHFPAIIH